MIPYARPDLNDEDVEAVVGVLKTDWLTQGPALEKFEGALSAYCGVRHAVAVSSATAGLHLAYLALGVGPGKVVWTSPNTFVSTANAAHYCGAETDFVDIDPQTYNLCPQKLADKIVNGRKKGRLPALIAPVHFAGQSCSMKHIYEIAARDGIKIVEDAAHAVGGTFEGKPVGCCEWSNAAVFSFHAVKIMTTGEGGMILTNDDELHSKLMRLRSHGITRNEDLFVQPSAGPWYYEQLDLGYHYRMTDFQAALGSSQLKRLDSMVRRRREIASTYNRALVDLPLRLPKQNAATDSSWHLYVVRLKCDEAKKSHVQVFNEMRAAGIAVNLHYLPVHLQPYYRQLGFKEGDFPEAERHALEAISLPMYSSLSHGDQARVIDTLQRILAP